jgi:hypothetical protein
MNAYWEMEIQLHAFLTSALDGGEWSVLYPQGKSPWHPLDRRLGGPQSRAERGNEEKNFKPLPGLEPPIIKSLAQRYTAELSRILSLCVKLNFV